MNPEISGGNNQPNDTVGELDATSPLFALPELEDFELTSEEDTPHYSVENYISHYNIDIGLPGTQLTAEGIGREIGTNSKWVQREIKRFGIKPEMIPVAYSNEPQAYYQPYVTELIREQHIWRQHYLSLPPRLSSIGVKEEVGRSYKWTMDRLEQAGYTGSVRRGERFKTYPKIAVKKLREINYETPLGDGWYHIRSLETITGQDYAWIIRQLSNEGLEPQKRRSAITGLDGRYYPPEALPLLEDLIAKRSEIPPAGEWLTLKAMARVLGKSTFWVNNNMLTEDANRARLMQDDVAIARTHYPASTLINLEQILLEYENLPELGEWLTIPRIMSATGQERTWLVPRIESSGFQPELRRVPKANRSALAYPPEIIKFIQDAIELRKPSAPNGWITAYGLTKLLNKSENWVKRRLTKYEHLSEPYEDEARVAHPHYPPSVISELQAELTNLEQFPAGGDWITLKPLARLVGKHAAWVAKTLEGLDITPETRLDDKGLPREHYSPESQKKIANYVLEHFTYPKAEGWVTFSDIFHYVGRSKPWIRSQIEAMNEEGEMRLDGVNTPRIHYDPNVAEKIKDISESLQPGNLLSLTQVAELANISKAVASRRLERLNIQGVDRFDQRGILTAHYAPEVVNLL